MNANIYQWIAILVSLTRDYSMAQENKRESNAIVQRFISKFTYQINREVGYEPYWMDGDFMIHDENAETIKEYGKKVETTTTQKLASTGMTRARRRKTSPPPMVCGEECNPAYQTIGPVCTHDTKNNAMEGCFPYYLYDNDYSHCWNTIPDTFVKPFHEFPSYCAYLEAICRLHFTSPRYILLHIGKCKDENFWFKDLKSFKNVAGRLANYSHVDLNTTPVKSAGLNIDTTKA